MHVYEPHEFDRVGWSPPQKRNAADASPPSKLRTAAAIILLTVFGLAVILAYFTLGHL